MKILYGKILCLLILAFGLTSCMTDSSTLYPSDEYPDKDDLKKTNLPIVYVQTSDNKEIDTRKVWKQASLTIDGKFCGYEDLSIDDLLIKGRGNTSWSLTKRPYSIKLNSKTKILGMKEDKHWVLIGNMSDKTLLRNYYTSYLGNEIYNSVWNPSFRSVHLIINGTCRGVYLLGEKITIAENRVDIGDISKKGSGNGGFILEVNHRLDELFNFTTNQGVPISLKDPDEVSLSTQKEITSIVQSAEDALFSDNFSSQQDGWRKYLDENSIIDWFIVNEFTKNNDAVFHTSVFLYYNPATEKLYLGPNWDYDISCGNINHNDNNNPNGWWITNAPWVSRLIKDSLFVENLNRRWDSSKSKVYYSINTWIPAQATSLENAANINFKKWKILGEYSWPNTNGFEERTTYQSEIKYLIDWLNTRYVFFDTALDDLVNKFHMQQHMKQDVLYR